MIFMKPMLLTQPGCQKCDWLKEKLIPENGVQILDVTTPEGMAQAAYYELIEKNTPILITEEEKVIEGTIPIKNELISGGYIIGNK